MFEENGRRLVKVLLSKGWKTARDTSPLSKRLLKLTTEEVSYWVSFGEIGFTLYQEDELHNDLVKIESLPYGRRQAQSLERLVKKDSERRRRCTNSNLHSEVAQKE